MAMLNFLLTVKVVKFVGRGPRHCASDARYLVVNVPEGVEAVTPGDVESEVGAALSTGHGCNNKQQPANEHQWYEPAKYRTQ